MPSVTAIRRLQDQGIYLPDEVSAVFDFVIETLPDSVKFNDNLAVFASAAVTNAATEIDDDGGALPLAIVCQSQGTAGYVQLYDTDDSSVTLDTTAREFQIAVGANSADLTWAVMGGSGFRGVFGTGLSIAAVTNDADGAMANLPLIWLLYQPA